MTAPGAAQAVILAGGRATRLGGADKPGIVVGGRTMLETAIAAARDAGAVRVIVVGPPAAGADVVAREDPPGSGPVPALRAGLAAACPASPVHPTGGPGVSWVLLLAADLPLLRGEHLTALAGAAHVNGTGAMLIDDDGQPQWLVSCWHAATLRATLAGYDGQSLRGLLAPLNPARLRLPETPWLDCDTPADLRRAEARAGGRGAAAG